MPECHFVDPIENRGFTGITFTVLRKQCKLITVVLFLYTVFEYTLFAILQ